MPLLAVLVTFFAVMTGLSIPIIAIVMNRSNKGGNAKIQQLESRIDELEQKVDSQQNEMLEMSSELEFTKRLLK